tara:strand:- start:1480 stop:1701 length:222 start_codon:yes stop_codon:yes gene_type:complete
MTKKIIVETFATIEERRQYTIEVPDDAPEDMEALYHGDHDELLEEIEKKIRTTKGKVLESSEDEREEVYEIRR